SGVPRGSAGHGRSGPRAGEGPSLRWYDGSREGAPGQLAGRGRWGAGRSAQALAGLHEDVEPVLLRGERAGPPRIERARRMEREVEVDDERPPVQVAAEV